MDPLRPSNHHHGHLGRAPSWDAPVTPPFSWHMPEWQRCGKHNCDTHHYQPNGYRDEEQLVPDLSLPVNMHVSHCHGCERPYNVVSLHLLPCNHALCRECLNDAAARIHNSIKRNRSQVDNILANAFLRRRMAAQADDRDLAARLRMEEGRILDEAWELAGFTCCGQPMRLGRFLYCMNPRVATTFWCDLEYVNTPRENHNYCGWPDCGAFVPGKCAFADRAGYRPVMLHCARCRGNGMLIARAGRSPESQRGIGNVWMPVGGPFPRYYHPFEV